MDKLTTDIFAAVAARDSQAVRELIKRGGDPNAMDAEGLYPIHHTARNGDFESAYALVEGGADPGGLSLRYADAQGYARPWHHANVNGHREFGQTLRNAAHTFSPEDRLKEMQKGLEVWKARGQVKEIAKGHLAR